MTEINTVCAVLELLPEPALILRDGGIHWSNTAAVRLGMTAGEDAAALLPEAELPEEGAALHWEAMWRDTWWEITARHIFGVQLLVLRKQEDISDNGLLLAAARGIQTPLEELLAAGASLFPQLEEMENEQLQRDAAGITRAAFCLLRSAAELNGLEQLRREEYPLCRQQCDLTAFLRELAERAADALREAGIRLEYQGPDSTVYGAIDQEEVLRAVLHLISNAAKFSREGTPILLKAAAAGKQLRISVTGSSVMEEDVLATAFSRFRWPTSTDPRQGMGLGLPLVRELAHRHGGNVLLSNREGCTEVLLSLDISQTDDALHTPRKDLTCGYDPYLLALSGVLPVSTYDSRGVEL